MNDYSNGRSVIIDKMRPMTISFTQSAAGFVNHIDEVVLNVEMSPTTYKIASALKKHRVVEGEGEVILGDTPAKLMQKLHQIYSGTVKFESGESILDSTKAEFIKDKFKGQKIGIFYKFREEYNALKSVFEDLHYAIPLMSSMEATRT